MQQAMVVHELHVTNLKIHPEMHVRIVGDVIKQIERGRHLVVQRCHVVEALRRIDVLPLIDHREHLVVPVEDRNLKVRLLAWWDFAPSIGCHRFEQSGNQRRLLFQHPVEDGRRRHQH